MAFLSGGQGRISLLILYTIRCFRTAVTREQIFTALSSADDTDYFAVCAVLPELEKELYLLSVPVHGQQLLYLTEKGTAFVAAFETEIARSVRDEIMGAADRERENVRRTNCVTADARPLPDGTWELDFSLVEKDSVIFEMKLRMPDAASAAGAERKWFREADEIYLRIYSELAENKKQL